MTGVESPSAGLTGSGLAGSGLTGSGLVGPGLPGSGLVGSGLGRAPLPTDGLADVDLAGSGIARGRPTGTPALSDRLTALARMTQIGSTRSGHDGFDPELLRHVWILKLAEEEAAIVGDVNVPERVVTLGSRGSIVYADGRETRVPARPLGRDPTGAGDAFATAYLVSRAAGHSPAAAARRATSVVGACLR